MILEAENLEYYCTIYSEPHYIFNCPKCGGQVVLTFGGKNQFNNNCKCGADWKLSIEATAKF